MNLATDIRISRIKIPGPSLFMLYEARFQTYTKFSRFGVFSIHSLKELPYAFNGLYTEQ